MRLRTELVLSESSKSSDRVVSKWTALSWINRVPDQTDGSIEASQVWWFSPAAIAQICMLSDGKGGLVGDEVYRDRVKPSFRGCPVQIVPTYDPKECRFALTDGTPDDDDWYNFEPLEVSLFSPTPSTFSSLPVFSQG